MALEIQGTIKVICPKEEGVSKSGNHWEKCTFVVETFGQYPDLVAFEDFNNRAGINGFQAGQVVSVAFNPKSQEYNGKYYTKLQAWRISLMGGQQPQQAAPQYQQPAQPATHQLPQNQNDLPF